MLVAHGGRLVIVFDALELAGIFSNLTTRISKLLLYALVRTARIHRYVYEQPIIAKSRRNEICEPNPQNWGPCRAVEEAVQISSSYLMRNNVYVKREN